MLYFQLINEINILILRLTNTMHVGNVITVSMKAFFEMYIATQILSIF